jgi:hypothetical protein
MVARTLTPQDRERRAQRAREILDDPLVSEALANMEKAVLQAFLDAGPDDDATRVQAQMALKCVRDFRAKIMSHIDAAMQASRQPIIIA